MVIITIVNGSFSTVTKQLLQRLGDLEVGGRVETNPTWSIDENGQNTAKNPGDLRDFLSVKFQWKTIS